MGLLQTQPAMTLKPTIALIGLFCLLQTASAQQPSRIRTFKKSFVTYPFSDPDPVATQGNIYPYFRFDGFTNTPVQKEWNVVELENDFIKVVILPEIGGKIWTAIDKTTGKAFLYDNKVIKFRDIAMRGPWTSGGLEPNYGIIGHTPNCATPVDYLTMQNNDGSVSCFIGVLDLLTRTSWQIEIHLPKDKAYFTTNSTWTNPTALGQPYYHWMNTGIKTKGNLEFIFPGTNYIGHDGEYADWPINKENGKKINFYEQNDFGTYKSYHVIGKQTDFFGAYWHEDQYGMVKYAPYDQKIGKKIWIWGLSRQGMIWEKMLTDQDGQYAEIQSGRLFNQNASGSSKTPFKHLGFIPHGTDRWTEYWYPVNQTQGIVIANNEAALNVKIEHGWLKWFCSPVAYFTDELIVDVNGKQLVEKNIQATPLQTISDSIRLNGDAVNVRIALKKQELEWRSDPDFKTLSRPLEAPKPFDWNSAEGLAIQGKELMDQKMFSEAEDKLQASLDKNPNGMLALVKRSELAIRKGDYELAFDHAKKAIAFDSHDAAANYYYGLAASMLNQEADAMDGFSVAAMGMEYRSAAYVEIAKIHARNRQWNAALEYATKATDFNKWDITAESIVYIAHKKMGHYSEATFHLEQIGRIQRLHPFYKWEMSSSKTLAALDLKNELAEESVLELAFFFQSLGLTHEAIQVLSLLPAHPLALYTLAYVKQDVSLLTQANTLTSKLVFPFRTEQIPVFKWAIQNSDHWKPVYYLALLLHDKNKKAEALNLLRTVNATPTEAHVYALRALWNQEASSQKEADLKTAMKLDESSWRYPKLLIQHYIQQQDYATALATCKQYKKQHPEKNYIIDMLLAKSLLLTKQYRSCDSLLSLMDIIPFEGATDGRGLYWEAKMMQAVEAMKLGQYKKALVFIQAAAEWPESLGVGKPYDADIDVRLEQYLSYICYTTLNNKIAATAALNKILDFNPGIYNTIRNFQPVNHLVTKWAKDAKGNANDWNKWMQVQQDKFPQYKEAFEWVTEAAHNQLTKGKNFSNDPWMRVIYAYKNELKMPQ